MKDKAIQIVLELLRDAKSRKFILSIGYGALVVYNTVYALKLTIWELLVILVPVCLFIVLEGIADLKRAR